jgi:hypothetical protein
MATFSQRSLRRRHAGLARVDGDGLSQRAGRAFEAGLGDVVAVLAVMQQEVQVNQGVRGHRFPENRNKLRVKVTDLLGRKVDSKHERHATAEVHGGRHERFFHRQRDAAVTDDPLLVSQRLGQRLAETDAGVLDRVVMIDVNVADRFDGQIEQRMLGQQSQHVIEEADTGVDVRLAAAVEIERQINGRLGRLPMNGGAARHGDAVS